jgi:hypothetical protein
VRQRRVAEELALRGAGGRVVGEFVCCPCPEGRARPRRASLRTLCLGRAGPLGHGTNAARESRYLPVARPPEPSYPGLPVRQRRVAEELAMLGGGGVVVGRCVVVPVLKDRLGHYGRP